MVSNRRVRLQKFDWLLFLAYLGLVGVGLLMVYATTAQDTTISMWSIQSVFGKQLMWAGISLAVLFAVYLIDAHFWSFLSMPLYFGGIIALLLLLVVGVEIKGAKSWINIAGFSVQPAEFVKFTTGVYLASILSSIKVKIHDIRSQLRLGMIILAPMALIVLQPDPGTAITFLSLFILLYRKGLPTTYYTLSFALFLVLVLSLKFNSLTVVSVIFFVFSLSVMDFSKYLIRSSMITILMVLVFFLGLQLDGLIISFLLNLTIALYFLFWKNIQRRVSMKFSLLGVVSALCLISVLSSYSFNNFLKPHQQDRVNVWLSPEKCDPRGSMYNLIQSKLAIGSGGLKGKGFLNGTYTKFNYVPEQTTDFIFSSIGEEQGFFGGIGVITLFLIVILRILQIGERSKYAFATNFCYVVAGFIFIHFFINIGMTMGIAPVIGIPLPFVSKGGSSLLAFSIMVGVVLKMNHEQ